MCGLETRSALFEAQNCQNSLLNSLLAGNLGRERLAPDCLLRHAVRDAEKLGCIPLKIAGNRRNSATLALKPDLCGTFSLEVHRQSDFSDVTRRMQRDQKPIGDDGSPEKALRP